jgi:hypothetical protein
MKQGFTKEGKVKLLQQVLTGKLTGKEYIEALDRGPDPSFEITLRLDGEFTEQEIAAADYNITLNIN